MTFFQTFKENYYPLEVRREEHLGPGVSILQYFPFANIGENNCINMNIYSWVVKIRLTSEAVLRPNTPLGHHTGYVHAGCGIALGEYCGPRTGSSVFLVIVFFNLQRL